MMQLESMTLFNRYLTQKLHTAQRELLHCQQQLIACQAKGREVVAEGQQLQQALLALSPVSPLHHCMLPNLCCDQD